MQRDIAWWLANMSSSWSLDCVVPRDPTEVYPPQSIPIQVREKVHTVTAKVKRVRYIIFYILFMVYIPCISVRSFGTAKLHAASS